MLSSVEHAVRSVVQKLHDVTIDTKCDYTAAFVNNNRYTAVAISTQNL